MSHSEGQQNQLKDAIEGDVATRMSPLQKARGMRPPRVLLLTAGFGNGHNSAAKNLQDGIAALCREAEVKLIDGVALGYGRAGQLFEKIFLEIVQHTPRLWGKMFSAMERKSFFDTPMGRLRRLQSVLKKQFETMAPDVVVSTYPAYSHVIEQIYGAGPRPFFQMVVITDSISIHPSWYAARADLYVVPNEASADVLQKAGVPAVKVLVYGFPVPLLFEKWKDPKVSERPRRVLYLIHHGKKKAGPVLEGMMGITGLQLTVVCGRNAGLYRRLGGRAARFGGRFRVLGWTDRMPELLLSHDLVITKAGGATVQEALAAKCPIVINQVIPGQEEGNALLVERLGVGVRVKNDRDLLDLLWKISGSESGRWRRWKETLRGQVSLDASRKIAEHVLGECRKKTPDAVETLRCSS